MEFNTNLFRRPTDKWTNSVGLLILSSLPTTNICISIRIFVIPSFLHKPVQRGQEC